MLRHAQHDIIIVHYKKYICHAERSEASIHLNKGGGPIGDIETFKTIKK